MTIKKIFDEISSEPGTNKKMEILSSYKENELLKRVLYLANSKRIKFYIKQIPEYTKGSVMLSLGDAIEMLPKIYERQITGHEAINFLKNILEQTSHDDAYIIERIVQKDPKLGMGTTNINKIFPKMVEDTPYQGAKSFDEELARKIVKDGTAFSQVKMDGRYANAIIRGGEVDLESRQGERTVLDGAKFISELQLFSDMVLNGELTMSTGVSRYESNGIIASLVSIGKKKLEGEDVTKEIKKFEEKHMNYQKALDSIQFTAWDIITVDEYFDAKSSTPYYTRMANLQRALASRNPKMVSIVDTKIVDTYEEAISHFQQVLNSGMEGTILKSRNGPWKDGKPSHAIKMKLEINVDLKIVGFNYGTGKNEKVISSVNAESSDGKVFTRPTGIDEGTMKSITENQDKLMGTIVEVKCCGLSNDSDGNYALLHPVFIKLRDDKNTCDSLESIQEIEAMAKGLTAKQKA